MTTEIPSWMRSVRTVGMCLALQAQGVRVAPNVSATKLGFLLDMADPDRTRDLCFGTVDTWAAWTLSKGSVHVTDSSNARLFWHAQLIPLGEPIWLPTYAPWLNPIEKLWRWLKETIIKMHRLASDWPALHQRVNDFLQQFVRGSRTLLRYVGLLGEGQLAQALHFP